MSFATHLMHRLQRFLRDERGAAGVEFLATLPLLIGTLVFTAEYGKALRHRMVLSTATSDAARFLSRTPLRTSAADPSTLELYPAFEDEAQAMLDARMGGPVDMGLPGGRGSYPGTSRVVPPVVDGPNLLDEEVDLNRADVYVIISTAADVNMPLLGYINSFLNWTDDGPAAPVDGSAEGGPPVATSITMFAVQTTPWLGSIDVDASEETGACISLNLCDTEDDSAASGESG